eukprot:711886-Hanusia_phi.AAC.1
MSSPENFCHHARQEEVGRRGRDISAVARNILAKVFQRISAAVRGRDRSYMLHAPGDTHGQDSGPRSDFDNDCVGGEGGGVLEEVICEDSAGRPDMFLLLPLFPNLQNIFAHGHFNQLLPSPPIAC